MSWMRIEKSTSPQEEQKLRRLNAIGFGFVAMGAIAATAMDFAKGNEWVGGRHLAMALLFGLLAYKGSNWWSGSSLGLRLLVVGALLLYIALYVVQVIVPLIRN